MLFLLFVICDDVITVIPVNKTYLRKADACNHNIERISEQYIIFNLLKSVTFLKVPFGLIPVNKDLE